MIRVLKVLLIGIFFDMRFRTTPPEINVNVNQGGRRTNAFGTLAFSK
jgi:hypothetical protein